MAAPPTYLQLQTAGFKVDTSDLLGLKYQAYLAAVRGLALSKPDQYFKMRAEVMEGVQSQIIKNLYDTLYAVLSVGTRPDGNVIFAGTVFGSPPYRPEYPQNKVNDFCVSVVRDLGDHINRCIDLILPDDFEKLAASKLHLKGRGNTISIDP